MRCFIGVQRLLWVGTQFGVLLNGVTDVRPAKKQQNGGIIYNVQPGLEIWDLHQEEVYPQSTKNPVLRFLSVKGTHFL